MEEQTTNPIIDALRKKAASIRCVTTKAAVNAVADAFETVLLAENESVKSDSDVDDSPELKQAT